ncbi:TPA: 30S ribosomal protein S2 [Candidatus Woesearchaeota archaeon]|nr:30S ribosomal protein S2 [Candidatus Woesearchaeota archaeon]HIH31618.1 30S ribosomal protein S2 [Candidatus Woesearchaeota archaeon]HIH55350.1 30S ribosomal protein S2 [Candidatus Woesearchaeota archaeon]HIJ01188.1 30S ribosomal protein S2 [Candidatus Woesearchaeota archaeon]HIJ14012.1 30S ribosomal protein S2 [Candidatus Woesearchaeota archaeon]
MLMQNKETKMADQSLLVPTDEYLKSGIHIGTKFKTKYMEKFIYKTRPDGLTVLNIQQIDERIRVAADMLSKYAPEDIVVISRRENGWKAVKMFGKITGIKTFAGRYTPGLMTNPQLKNFLEAKIVLVVDAWPDKNAVLDAYKVGIPVIALCDTNNNANYIDLVIPCNNKGKKSLGLLFMTIAQRYMMNKHMIRKPEDFKYKMDDFSDE